MVTFRALTGSEPKYFLSSKNVYVFWFGLVLLLTVFASLLASLHIRPRLMPRRDRATNLGVAAFKIDLIIKMGGHNSK